MDPRPACIPKILNDHASSGEVSSTQQSVKVWRVYQDQYGPSEQPERRCFSSALTRQEQPFSQ
jgi:hypothetical protein